jgi:hypothetical protein
MKKSIFLLFAITMIFLVSQAQGAEWVSLGKGSEGIELFYDRSTLTKPQMGIIKVWLKLKYSDEGKRLYIQEMKKAGLSVDRYQALDSSSHMYEINCMKRQVRIMALGDFAADGSTLDQKIMKPSPSEGWETIEPDSMLVMAHQTVCQSQKK